jgi:hypothetical protein
MTAEVSTRAWAGTPELVLPSYERPSGLHPPSGRFLAR